MLQALKISDISRKDKVHRGVAYQRSKRNKYPKIILPIKTRHQYQLAELKRWLYGVQILQKMPSGSFEKQDVTTLVPCEKGQADVALTYWSQLYFYKLPKDHIFMKT